VIVFFAGLMCTFCCIWMLKKPAVLIGLLDQPGGRKSHEGAVPLIGGIAMFCGFVLSALLLQLPSFKSFIPFISGMVIMIVVGALDDYRDLSAKPKFFAQISAAALMVLWGGNAIANLGNLVGNGEIILGGIALPFTIFCVVGLVNALNLSDGLDGLAGGLALVASLALTVVATLLGSGMAVWLLLLSSVIAGFLVFNLRHPLRKRASVFMGDAGSMMLGYALVWFAVHLTQRAGPHMPPVTAVWIFALPLMDTVAIMIRRISKGRNPFEGDREHLHHILLLAGYSHAQTVFILLALAVLMGGIGVGFWMAGVPDFMAFFLFLGLFALYFMAMRNAWKTMKVLHHWHDDHSHAKD